jgi:hypothetical protein
MKEPGQSTAGLGHGDGNDPGSDGDFGTGADLGDVDK